jgi:hypothetical protein
MSPFVGWWRQEVFIWAIWQVGTQCTLAVIAVHESFSDFQVGYKQMSDKGVQKGSDFNVTAASLEANEWCDAQRV